MIITKGDKAYIISELETKWVAKTASGKIEVDYSIPKELCPTAEELREYILSEDLF